MGIFSGIGKAIKGVVKTVTSGDILGAGLSFLGGERANEANSAQSAAQMDFQREMRDTSYQAAMADMEKAGLNPILAYQQGGASVPAGASASMSDTLTPAVATAMQGRRLRADLENLEETNKNLQSSNDKIKSDTALNKALRTAAIADANLKNSSAASARTNNALLESQLPKAEFDAEFDKSLGGKILRGVERVGESVGRGLNAASSARGMFNNNRFGR